MDKIKHGIERIEINDATLNGVVIEPTLINFFFGNNGTGKSTVARAIRDKTGLTWHPDVPADEYETLIFDHDYVDTEFRSFEKLRGVFTVGALNADTQEKITTRTAEKRGCDTAASTAQASAAKKKTELDTLLENFRAVCWGHSTELRSALGNAMAGYKGTKILFATEVLKGTSPVEYNLHELQAMCETAFSASGRNYPRFNKTGSFSQLASMSEIYKLLGVSITSSSDSEFARFVSALNAADWVSQGHKHYSTVANGKCPYCQRELPADFEENIASCFDAQYQQDVANLQRLLDAYSADMNGFIAALETNLQAETLPKIDTTEYKTKLELFKRTVEGNIRKIADKIKEPSSVVVLDDVKMVRDEINAIIDGFNAIIDENNTIIASKGDKQKECIKKTKELIAFTLAADIKAYNDCFTTLDKEYHDFQDTYKKNHDRSVELDRELTALNKDGVGTRATIDAVNKTLRDAGLQGFRLYPKDGEEHVYEVRRDGSDKPANNLSEGERNFIAFLYFYHVVRGSYEETGKKKRKIVVIDDPITSMDSGVLFLVSSLVRELIEICYNNVNLEDRTFKGDEVAQIFILTHNTYFHREITYNQIGRFDFVSYFLVQKRNNVSTVRLCTKENRDTVPPMIENYNPVQNSYKALWSEYKELSGSITTMSVIRRILEYYFLQLCGYDGVNLRKDVLEKNKHRFIVPSGDGTPDNDDKYHLALSMLSYIGKQDHGFNDGMDFVDESADVTQCRDVFWTIFDCLGQTQHYDMMMGNEALPK